jgi:hypothetical protein
MTNTNYSLSFNLLVTFAIFIPVRNNDPEGNENKDRPCIWILIYPIRFWLINNFLIPQARGELICVNFFLLVSKEGNSLSALDYQPIRYTQLLILFATPQSLYLFHTLAKNHFFSIQENGHFHPRPEARPEAGPDVEPLDGIFYVQF